MQKQQRRNKSLIISEGPGVFYAQRKCETCGKLLWGSSEKSRRQAEKDLGQKLKAHKQDCQKQAKQLDLPIPAREEKQTESIKRVTLRGEKKS